jgi:hypothetical protein
MNLPWSVLIGLGSTESGIGLITLGSNVAAAAVSTYNCAGWALIFSKA